MISKGLVRAIVDIAIFLEFTDSNLLDEDAAVSAMEQFAHGLQNMTAEEQVAFSESVRSLAPSYPHETSVFVSQLPENLGLV